MPHGRVQVQQRQAKACPTRPQRHPNAPGGPEASGDRRHFNAHARTRGSAHVKPISAALILLALVRWWPHASLAERVPPSTTAWSADGELLRVTLAADDQYRLWTPLRDMSPVLVDAFLLKEDRLFYWHAGVNPWALSRAGLRTWRGAGRQGGSTITMQLARMLYGLKTRTATGKLRQMAAAAWLELRYSKRDLLEAYLNLAPFGGNVQGVGAASRMFFGKSPARVSVGEAVTLAVIPQSPAARTGPGLQREKLQKARAQLAAL